MRHHPSRRALRAAALTCVALGALQLVGTAGAAPVCVRDPATHTVVAQFEPGETDASVFLSPSGSDMGIFAFTDSGYVQCGDATTTNTDSIEVSGAGGSIDLDATASPEGFAPGFTPEPTGQSEIEISVSGFSTLFYDVPKGLANTVHVGTKGIAVNGDDDVDITYFGITTIAVGGGASDDTFSAQGGDGSGKKLPADMTFQVRGGGGTDVVVGHDGTDEVDLADDLSGEVSGLGGDDTLLTGFRSGPYLLDGGPGNDTLEARGSGATLLGGSGDDTFELEFPAVAFGGAGNDEFDAANGSADVIHGDGGTDTATVDPEDVLTKVENVS